MSQIEQIITEIEDYMDSCKKATFQSGSVIVNKEEMDELLAELRLKTPEEVKKYQKIIQNKEAIINDAKERSDAMIAEATSHITELVSEHEIMQKAQNQADAYVLSAQQEAKSIIEEAEKEAESIRESAMAYTDELLANIQEYLSMSIHDFETKSGNALSALKSASDNAVRMVTKTTEDAVDTMAGSKRVILESLNKSYSTVTSNRRELRGESSANVDYRVNLDE